MSRKALAFPGWSSNPYINMLYLAPRAAGWRVGAPKTMDELATELKRLDRGDILHVHWLAPVFDGVATHEEGTKREQDFYALVDGALATGARLFWTVHNVVTHDSEMYEHEVAVSEFLADRAEIIFVLNEATVEVTSEHYTLPVSKLRTLRHPSYLGVYPDGMTREAAREVLGVDARACVVGFVGQARPYKGINTLLRAMEELGSLVAAPLTLLIAGKTPSSELDVLRAAIDASDADIRWNPAFVPNDELQVYFRASDVVALPYARVLNSGSAYLSATFETPCVLPDEPQFRALFGEQEWVTLFDRDAGSTGLAKALLGCLPQRSEAADSAGRFARSRTPYDMSREYYEIITR